eukprot:TRINITY_DN27483_c0_g1_i1.p1 TRINITY_DN27483_c0_g1~~TRINITY_DN27483_c0_g1_i1.p1  ORF type:complete len:323 (-),score=82.84 TRINITY_DN27483_c0_g1_i1:226-1194(-)
MCIRDRRETTEKQQDEGGSDAVAEVEELVSMAMQRRRTYGYGYTGYTQPAASQGYEGPHGYPAYGYTSMQGSTRELGGLKIDHPSAHKLGESSYNEVMHIGQRTQAAQLEFSRIEFAGLRVEHHAELSELRSSLDGAAQRLRELRRCIELNEQMIMESSGVVPCKQLIEQLAAVLDHVIHVDGAIAEAITITTDLSSHQDAHQSALDQSSEIDQSIAAILADVELRAARTPPPAEKNFADTEYVQRSGSLEKWGGQLNGMRLALIQGGTVDLGKLKQIWDKIGNTKALGPGDCTTKAELLHGTGGCEWLYQRAKLATLKLEQ